MGHRNNLDFAVAQPVDQAEGKPGKHVAPGASAMSGPSLRCLGHRLNGMLQLLAKTTCRHRAADRVPCIGCFCLVGGRRVKPNGDPGHSSCREVAPSPHPKGWFGRPQSQAQPCGARSRRPTLARPPPLTLVRDSRSAGPSAQRAPPDRAARLPQTVHAPILPYLNSTILGAPQLPARDRIAPVQAGRKSTRFPALKAESTCKLGQRTARQTNAHPNAETPILTGLAPSGLVRGLGVPFSIH